MVLLLFILLLDDDEDFTIFKGRGVTKVDKLSDFRLALLDDDRLTLLPFEDKKLDASFKLSFDTFTAFPDPV